MMNWTMFWLSLLAFSPMLVVALICIRTIKRKSDGYSQMARSMREIRDWEREHTPDEPSALRIFKDTFK